MSVTVCFCCFLYSNTLIIQTKHHVQIVRCLLTEFADMHHYSMKSNSNKDILALLRDVLQVLDVSCASTAYPAVELRWLVSFAWNRGLQCYCHDRQLSSPGGDTAGEVDKVKELLDVALKLVAVASNDAVVSKEEEELMKETYEKVVSGEKKRNCIDIDLNNEENES